MVERHPENGGLLEHPPGVGRKPIDPGEEQPVQRGWNVHLIARACTRPPIALADEHARTHQGSDDLLDKKWIAPCPRRDEMLDGCESSFIHFAEQADDERLNLVGGKRREPDDVLRSPRDKKRRCVGAMRDQHHQGPLGQLFDNVAKEFHRGRVGPMEIFHEEQHGPMLKAPLHEGTRRQHNLALKLFGIEVSGALLLDREQEAQYRDDNPCNLGRSAERAKACSQLLSCNIEESPGSTRYASRKRAAKTP